MKVKVMIELDINEKQYDNTYTDCFHAYDSESGELIKTEKSNREMINEMKRDITANAQYGIQQWAKRLSFDVDIKNNLIEE